MEFSANGLWFAPNCEKCFRTNKYLTHGDKFVDTHGDHIDLTKQVTTSCSHHFAGIRASTMTNSTKIKHSSKRNYLQLPRWAKTWDAWPALLQVNTSSMETWTNLSSELTNNVFTRWDESYPLLEFPPCTKLQNKEVDPVENCHIPQDKFNEVPLI